LPTACSGDGFHRGSDRSSNIFLFRKPRYRYRQSHSTSIQDHSRKTHQPPYEILVFGGSQGAQAINMAIRASLPLLTEWKTNCVLRIRQEKRSCRKRVRHTPTRDLPQNVQPFFNEFHQRYATADLIVSRAGATTVAEIKAAGACCHSHSFPLCS
jgi:UDP-N-acetylglucosamine--N-acetylmuramyl-(pentapeptide) pyrophosphoryl-undecaprenol N-acetylglucosamine transferase